MVEYVAIFAAGALFGLYTAWTIDVVGEWLAWRSAPSWVRKHFEE